MKKKILLLKNKLIRKWLGYLLEVNFVEEAHGVWTMEIIDRQKKVTYGKWNVIRHDTYKPNGIQKINLIISKPYIP